MKTILAAALMAGLMITPALADTVAATPAAMSASPSAAPRQGVFEKADANHDGTVTREEFLASEGQYFDSVDMNHDGKLSQDEIKAQRDKSRAKHMAWRQAHMGGTAPGAGTVTK